MQDFDAALPLVRFVVRVLWSLVGSLAVGRAVNKAQDMSDAIAGVTEKSVPVLTHGQWDCVTLSRFIELSLICHGQEGCRYY
ncbi:MAG: hypothetical protein ACK456_13255 [Pseudanabaenaceae cyanobacterium]